MKTGIIDMTNINGQLSLMLTAENTHEQVRLDELRERLQPVDFSARQLDPTGTGNEVLVIPLEQLLKKPGFDEVLKLQTKKKR